MKAHVRDYELMLEAYSSARGDPAVFADDGIAHLVIHENRVLGAHLVPGLEIEPQETASGIDLKVRVLPETKIEKPVHLCFGVLPESGEQNINIAVEVGCNAGVKLLAHCIFPNAISVRHNMQAQINIAENGFYGYDEVHFHGQQGGATVIPKAKITLGEGASLATGFQLTSGRVGELDIDYEVEAGPGSVAEMIARVFGSGSDRIRIREKCVLAGERARGIIKSRVAVKGSAISEVFSEMAAVGALSRGHVDCIEIVQEEGRARAVPVVEVFDHTAKVTHEAAIGSVDRKQLETLMARGLKQEQAVDLIIRGMLSPV
ncbi:MAG: SufD family Fe-S cluster assembly protein [Thermoleophilia bacterium]|jgi:hypothetical protein